MGEGSRVWVVLREWNCLRQQAKVKPSDFERLQEALRPASQLARLAAFPRLPTVAGSQIQAKYTTQRTLSC